ncbi:RluA family pseudouridine synthase [Marinobacter sp. C2H3]|uniref:RluA family pseudouridine synthase n=1 Tax=Marinobacter sp. C2H3 TaxID=3119003 RepID=UPI00300EFFA8
MRLTVDITPEHTRLAVDALSEASGLPKQRIKDAMTKGACWWIRKGKQVRLRRAKQEVAPGTRLMLYYDDAVLARTAEPAVMLANTGRYSVWFKPHGLLSQGSQWGDHCSLLRLAELALKKPVFLVHRLDADAAGLMLIAHDGKAAAALSECFAGRTMEKVYLATVVGPLETTDRQITDPVDGKSATSRVTTVPSGSGAPGAHSPEGANETRVQVVIETGRKHQIRRHLAGIGHPIVGDRLYGTAERRPLQLLAYSLRFDCPLTRRPQAFTLPDERITLTAPGPAQTP